MEVNYNKEGVYKLLNKNENKIIFDIVQAALFQKEIEISKKVELNRIFQEMKDQTIAGIPYEWLSSKNILDVETKKQWDKFMMFQMAFWIKLMQEQENLIQLMKQNYINMVILKGTAAAIYYPKPEVRSMGDIDFFVNPKDFQKACKIMIENGYRSVHEKQTSPHHIAFKKNKVTFEVHKSLSIIARNHVGNHQEYLQTFMENGLVLAEQKKIEHWEFPTFPRLQSGLVLLLHITQHLKTGLGLRQILDWSMFVNQELDDEIWKTEFQPILQKIGLETMAITVTRMSQIYLGLTTEGITWCLSADQKLCEKLLEYFMEKGNFGKKAAEKERGVKVLSVDKNLLEFLKKLQYNGRNNWKLTEKYWILRPFAWIYQMCIYIQLALNRKHPISTFRKDWKKSRERIQLFRKLKLFIK